jgi:hypothetical protein
VVRLPGGDAPPKSKLNDEAFAILPRRVSAGALEKAAERAFENLRSREESPKARQELRCVASHPGTLNKTGVALSRQLDVGAICRVYLSLSQT